MCAPVEDGALSEVRAQSDLVSYATVIRGHVGLQICDVVYTENCPFFGCCLMDFHLERVFAH